MKKNFRYLFLAISVMVTLASCDSQKVIVNREVDTKNDGKMLLGTQTLDQFTKEPYSTWYTKEYQDYPVDQPSIEKLKKEKLGSYNMTVFLGTWCSDSQREFPQLMKILDAVKYPTQKLTIITVNRKKEAPQGEESTHNIHRVPTIILTKYGKEVGRIIENPKSGWIEKDLVEILQKSNASLKDIF